MELYHAAASPFVRKVRVVLHETGQTDAVTLIDSAQTPLNPNPANQNPLGKIPCLTRPDGPPSFARCVSSCTKPDKPTPSH